MGLLGGELDDRMEERRISLHLKLTRNQTCVSSPRETPSPHLAGRGEAWHDSRTRDAPTLVGGVADVKRRIT